MNKTQLPRWNEKQLAVINCKPFDRLIVDGGPGTGKTAVLSARIARMIDVDGISPSNIWVISFTRTAVAELRGRLSTYLNNRGDAFGIRVATIDSHAWSVNSGFDSAASISGNFDRNIERVIELVRKHEGVFEYLNSVSHIFIDEAQDVVGIRQELLLEIINAIPPSAGVTVFADKAQSIYSFAEKAKPDAIRGTLPENVKDYFGGFSILELEVIHRTDRLSLCELYRDARLVLKSQQRPHEILHGVRKMVLAQCDGKAPRVDELPAFTSTLSGETFILFRTRGEAFHAANVYFRQNAPCRLRLSGLPNVIHPWVASIFWDWTKLFQSDAEFHDRWIARMGNSSGLRADQCWMLLVQHFGRSKQKIDVEYMRYRLSSLSPPIEFCASEFGGKGPVIGTIHTSKGRESENVIVYLPKAPAYRASQTEESMEEARTVFVGVTRARRMLFVGNAETGPGRTHRPSGRAFREIGLRLSAVNVEVGRTQDICAENLTGMEMFHSQDDAARAQHAISTFNSFTPVMAQRASLVGRFSVVAPGHTSPVCGLSTAFEYDIRGIVRELHLRTYGRQLKELQIVGARTLVVSPQDNQLQKLHRPWSESGFMMAPLLIGFPTLTVGYR